MIAAIESCNTMQKVHEEIGADACIVFNEFKKIV